MNEDLNTHSTKPFFKKYTAFTYVAQHCMPGK